MALVLLLIMFSGLVPPLFLRHQYSSFSALFLTSWEEVGVKTIYGSLIYPFFVGITSGMPVLTHNIFLAQIIWRYYYRCWPRLGFPWQCFNWWDSNHFTNC